MKKQKLITVHTCALTQILFKNKTEFADIRSFNIYKKDKIYQLRNQLLSETLNKKIIDTDIIKTAYGKPYLANNSNFSFNHSHSQQNYALGFSHCYNEIGIDVEDLTRIVRYEALANHAFHFNELSIWKESNYSKEYWFKVWTTKEAVLKAAGLGIRINLKDFDTQAHFEKNTGYCYHPVIGEWCYQNFYLEGMVLTVSWRLGAMNEDGYFPQIDLVMH